MADRNLVIRALIRDQLRKEQIPIGISPGEFRRKIHRRCADFGLQPEAMGEAILPIIDEMIEETRNAIHAAFKS